MIRALGDQLSRFSSRWVPDPFAIAMGLTLVTLVLCMVATGNGPLDIIGNWGGRLNHGELLPKEMGLWKLLAFGMQMCLILVTGHALASSRPVHRLLDRLANAPQTPEQAVALTALVAMFCALINWGLGLIVGALIARNVARSAKERGIRVHYPVLGAAGYSGLLVWHGGLSGSAPLSVTQQKDIVAILGRSDVDPIALGETLFSSMNLIVNVLLFVLVPMFLVWMLPKDSKSVVPITYEQAAEDTVSDPPPAKPTPADRFERSFILTLLIAAMGVIYLVQYFNEIGIDRIDLNSINLAFIVLGFLLHGNPRSYGRAISEATASCSGIILAFPFYAGIMGMMDLSGLVSHFAGFISEVAGPIALAPLSFLSAGAVNLFVPSGGGQWAIQGPIVIQAADNLGLPLGKAVMAVAYGDQWTNMLQPFWALPLLGITGLRARDIIGYTGALMLLVAPIFLICLVVL
jgi:short-chain fatty acids transporter